MESTERFGFGRYRASLEAASGAGSTGAPRDTGVVHGFFVYAPGHGEIDVEILSCQQSPGAYRMRFTMHREGEAPAVASGGPLRIPFDPSARFHVDGFDWRPTASTSSWICLSTARCRTRRSRRTRSRSRASWAA